MIAAIKPTIPASPKDCTKPITFDAIPLTKGTFPPSRLNTIPNASREITTFVRLSKIDVSPAIAFMFSPIFFTKSKTNHFVLIYMNLPFLNPRARKKNLI